MNVSCTNNNSKSDISVSLEVTREPVCVNMCYRLKVIFKNNTEKYLYLPEMDISEGLGILDSNGQNAKDGYFHEESFYFAMNTETKLVDSLTVVYDGGRVMEFDTNQISQKRNNDEYKSFIAKAIDSEILKYKTKLTIEEIVFLTEILPYKYAQVILLKPKSSEYALFHINSLFNKGDERKVFFKSTYFNSSEVVKFEVPQTSSSIFIDADFPKELNVYSLFEGTFFSDTLTIN